MSSVPEWYVIEGHPSVLAKVRFGSGKTWNNYQEIRTKWKLSLENQHGNNKPFTGPLKLIVIFYYPIPHNLPEHFKNSLTDSTCLSGPALSALLKFIELIGKGTLFNDENLLCSIEIQRKYDRVMRTQFKVVPIHD